MQQNLVNFGGKDMWNKTIFEYNQKAADFLKESVDSCLELFPDDKDMKAAKEIGTFLGYTCKEDSTKITNEEKEKLNATVEDFIAGWKGWHVWEWKHKKHIQVSFPDTYNVPEPVVYGEVELCDGCYDDYYVITTEDGEKFLKARLAEVANIPVDEIEYIQWSSENSDNIEDICNFFIFTHIKQVSCVIYVKFIFGWLFFPTVYEAKPLVSTIDMAKGFACSVAFFLVAPLVIQKLIKCHQLIQMFFAGNL